MRITGDKKINVNIGRYNFDTIHYDYYRDKTVALEAFKSGAYDFKQENSSKNWATAYKFGAVKDGKVNVEEIKILQTRVACKVFAFNMRKSIFENRNVRKALNLLLILNGLIETYFMVHIREQKAFLTILNFHLKTFQVMRN